MIKVWEIRNVGIPGSRAKTIRISGEKIIGVDSDNKDLPFLDGKELVAIPGVIDPHVHFRTPGWEQKEDWETGSRAAIRGGATTVFDMPNTPQPCTSMDALQKKLDIIGKRDIDYRLWFGATGDDNSGEIRKALENPIVIGIKVYMGSSTGNLLVTDMRLFQKYLSIATESGKIVGVHAEDEALITRNRSLICGREPILREHSIIRNTEVEVSAVRKALSLQKKTGARIYFCHISTPEAVRIISKAKKEGRSVYIEVSPHHLWFSRIQLFENSRSSFFKMNPPLRRLDQALMLRSMAAKGTIDTIGSDHAPHTRVEKMSRSYDKTPSGVPGVEMLLPTTYKLVLAKKMNMSRLIDLTSRNTAKIFDLKSKGAIASGYDADLVLFHPSRMKSVREESVVSKCGWTPFRGMFVGGIPEIVIARGVLHEIQE